MIDDILSVVELFPIDPQPSVNDGVFVVYIPPIAPWLDGVFTSNLPVLTFWLNSKITSSFFECITAVWPMPPYSVISTHFSMPSFAFFTLIHASTGLNFSFDKGNLSPIPSISATIILVFLFTSIPAIFAIL